MLQNSAWIWGKKQFFSRKEECSSSQHDIAFGPFPIFRTVDLRDSTVQRLNANIALCTPYTTRL